MAVILGINSYHAGASACLVVDGVPVAALAEERLNRIKYYAGFPTLAIRRCLEIAGVTGKEIDVVAIGRDTSKNRMKKAEYALRHPGMLAKFISVKKKSDVRMDFKGLMAEALATPQEQLNYTIHNVEHHLAHTASAYFISPWDKTAGFTLDGSGDFVTGMMTRCEGDRIEILNRIYVPHSAGFLYTMICQIIGYGAYGDEGKVMGLAPYGEDSYREFFEKVVTLKDNSFELDLKYFLPFGSGGGISIGDDGTMAVPRMYSDEVVKQLGVPRAPEDEISQRDMDLSFGLQRRFEDIYLHLLNELHKKVGGDHVVLAGGSALNSVVNGKIFDNTPFKETCIQPASGDDGIALGAALYVSNSILKEGNRWVMENSYLGDEFSDSEIRAALDRQGIVYQKCEREELLNRAVEIIVKGDVMGWFQGRAEWGPRALGNRSILVHPGLPEMKETLNSRIKRREWYRPFAPAVLEDRQSELFEHNHPSPFMLHVYKIRPEWRERLCAVNHADNTGRLQTVKRPENPLYYDLISKFCEQSGIPVLLNTSFNENEPIVATPDQAIDCFMRTKMDVLAIGSYFCLKTNQKNVSG